jgi:CubicO group peptidase (beta-lactamase class C family)
VPAVTVRQLLSHTAGFTVHGFLGYRRDRPVPTLEQVLLGARPANNVPVVVDLVPGTQRRYSGGGFCVVQTLAEELTGLPFPHLMDDLVLRPLGMSHSTFENPLPERLWDHAAWGHHSSGAEVWGQWFVYPEMAAAGLWTTATDLGAFAGALQRTLRGDPGAVLPPDIARAMVTPQIGGCGLGVNLGGPEAHPRFGHQGSDVGFQANMVATISDDFGVVMMTNSDLGLTLVDPLNSALTAAFGWDF